jgi:predicted CoA-binding protein
MNNEVKVIDNLVFLLKSSFKIRTHKNRAMKVSKAQIQNFFDNKSLAIAGVSRNEKKFGNTIFKELLKKDFQVFPINPNTEEIDGHKCFKSVEDLPSNVNSLLITTPKKQTDEVLKMAIQKGIQNI